MKYLKSMTWIASLAAAQLSFAQVVVNNYSSQSVSINGVACAPNAEGCSYDVADSIVIGENQTPVPGNTCRIDIASNGKPNFSECPSSTPNGTSPEFRH